MTRSLRWDGWGDVRTPLPAGLLAVLRDELGVTSMLVDQPRTIDQVTVPPSRLEPGMVERLRRLVGPDHVLVDHKARVRHATGRSYTDLVRLRSGKLDSAPDAVVEPADAREIARVLAACGEARCAVVPFGGGTSVTGGVDPVGGPGGIIALDVVRLNRVLATDLKSLTATLGAGMRGPAVEAALRRDGVTLGHYPQSFEFATVGGFAATRSAGQASSGVGRFDDLVVGLRCVTPHGEIEVRPFPSTGAGPAVRELLLGSEGVMGVITEATVRLHRRPRRARLGGWTFPSFEAGAEAARALAQSEDVPDIVRVSDAEETRVSFSMAGERELLRRYLRLRGQTSPCFAVTGWETEVSSAAVRAAAAVMRRHGGVSLGRTAGESWRRRRFEGPYLRDALMDIGVLVETVETAASWSSLHRVRNATLGALREALTVEGFAPLLGCHVSHVYATGASLYVTVLARQEKGRALEQWRAAKAAVTEAILGAGGTLTHHHSVGRDHTPWLDREIGPVGVAALRAVKRELDPAGIMNPGVLLQSGS